MKVDKGQRGTAILFICTGNICRSPTAEGVFRRLAEREGVANRFRIDSAGIIGYHAGESPDRRSQQTALTHGVDIGGQRARKVTRGDFSDFDYLLAMDGGHLGELAKLAPPEHVNHVGLFLSFWPEAPTADVPDPYFGGPEGFQQTYALIDQGCRHLLDHLVTRP